MLTTPTLDPLSMYATITITVYVCLFLAKEF